MFLRSTFFHVVTCQDMSDHVGLRLLIDILSSRINSVRMTTCRSNKYIDPTIFYKERKMMLRGLSQDDKDEMVKSEMLIFYLTNHTRKFGLQCLCGLIQFMHLVYSWCSVVSTRYWIQSMLVLKVYTWPSDSIWWQRV